VERCGDCKAALDEASAREHTAPSAEFVAASRRNEANFFRANSASTKVSDAHAFRKR
jgi:hypothetical protein